MEKNLTTGSVGRQLIGFSLPYLLSYLLQTLYGMADLFIIGRYEGVAGTTAVAVGSQVMHMLTVMIVGLAMGTTVSIARAIGADDRPLTVIRGGFLVDGEAPRPLQPPPRLGDRTARRGARHQAFRRRSTVSVGARPEDR